MQQVDSDVASVALDKCLLLCMLHQCLAGKLRAQLQRHGEGTVHPAMQMAGAVQKVGLLAAHPCCLLSIAHNPEAPVPSAL